jgi:xanthine dehydrogenase accessory factor
MDHAGGEGARVEGATAVIVASHGRDEGTTIRAALDAGVNFVGLVASHARGAAVVDELGLNDDERRAVRSPVGLDIGARTAEEIALSILGELVRAVRIEGLEPPKSAEPQRPATAVDPVCGMTVVVSDDTPHLHHDGTDHWFCNPGCRTRFADELGIGL